MHTSISIPYVNTSILGIFASTLVLDSFSALVSIPLVGNIQVFTTSPTISTIVSISKSKALMSIVEPKTQLKLLISGKEIEEDIDLGKEIEILKLDFDNATIEEMRLVS